MSFLFLALLLIAWPVAEIWMWIKFCHSPYFDIWGLLAIIIATGIVGWRLLKRESLMMLLLSVQAGMSEGNLPQKIMEGLLVFAAALLLLLPGLIGDCIGLLLLINPVRALVARLLVWWFRKSPAKAGAVGGMPGGGAWMFTGMSADPGAAGSTSRPAPDGVIDVEAREITPEADGKKNLGK
jgi:UPF0716 protein FxsA